jgi:hypothetical protein
MSNLEKGITDNEKTPEVLETNQRFIDAKFIPDENDSPIFNSEIRKLFDIETPKKVSFISSVEVISEGTTKEAKVNDIEAQTLYDKDIIDEERNTLLKEDRKKPRGFCNKVRSQKTWKIIIIQLIILSTFFIIVFASLVYHIMFPWWLQYQLEVYNPESEFRFHTMALTAINADSVKIKLDIRHNPLIPESVPIVAGVTESLVTFAVGGLEIGSVIVPATDFWLNREITLSWEITLGVNEEQKKNLAKLVSKFSTPEGLQNWIVYISSSVPITLFGKTVYSALPLYMFYPMNDMAGNIDSLMKVSNSLSSEKSSIHLITKDQILGSLLSDKFKPDDIMRLPQLLGYFDLVWRTVEFLADDVSLSFKMAVAFENHTPFELLTIGSLDYFLEVEGVKFVKMSIINAGLKPNLNEDFVIDFKLTFIDPDIDSLLVSETINKVLDGTRPNSGFDINGDNRFQFAISGPVTISNCDVLPELTKDFRITGELHNFLAFIPKSVVNTISNPTADLTPEQVQAILDIFGTADLTILSETLNARFGINLPLNGLKLPRQFEFPYNITLALYGENVKVMQAVFNPFMNQREADILLTDLSGSVSLINTEEASVALSNSVNPIFSRFPTSSVLELRDFGLFNPGKPNFKWVDVLFGKRNFLLSLPPIDKETFFGVRTGKKPPAKNSTNLTMVSRSTAGNTVTRLPTFEDATNTISNPAPAATETNDGTPIVDSNSTKLPFLSFSDIDVAQLNDRPGFNVSVSMDANIPRDFPDFYIDIGYFHLDITMESVKMIGIELPKDLRFLPNDKVLEINGTVIFHRDPRFAPLIQSIVDGILKDRSLLPAYVGLTGLVLGGSKDVVTLNKIVIEMDTNLAVKIVQNLFLPQENGAYISVDQRPLLDGFRNAPIIAIPNLVPTFSVDSVNGFSLALRTEIFNPLPLSLSLGRIDLYGYIGDSNLIGTSIAPIEIGIGFTTLNLGASLSILASFQTIVQTGVLVIDAALHKKYYLDLSAGFTGLKLTPTDAFSETAIIDQFENVKIGVPMGKILKMLASPET